ncbi:hypothetical protein [Aureimonas leprariae]|uniref:Uncharacterized protein n=1 Tax=Plantimonas leprariae TaxID=2615207 RepID=A0A7V7PL34_9HYPH|nr:hypothetical protein [Aureimonas leprariae]KAB0676850.1 hypothetical protein F6X38_19970 [Aureimonas leprariae]
MVGQGENGVRLDGQGFALAARLAAACLSRDGLSATAGRGTLAAGEVAALAAHPAFRRPLGALLARERNWPGLSAGRMAVLFAAPEGRMAALVASEPRAVVEGAGRLLAAAVLHKRVLQVVLRADRERLRAVLGAEAFGIATQEAPTLHAGLAALERDPVVWRVVSGDDTAHAARRLADFGLELLARFAAGVDAALGHLACSRFAVEGDCVLDEAERAAVLKLLRRRVPSWPAIIG